MEVKMAQIGRALTITERIKSTSPRKRLRQTNEEDEEKEGNSHDEEDYEDEGEDNDVTEENCHMHSTALFSEDIDFNEVDVDELSILEAKAGITTNTTNGQDIHTRVENLKKTNELLLSKPRTLRRPPIGGKWSCEEDDRLRRIVSREGAKNWKKIAEFLGTTRTDVQCLHRWNKVLKPGLHKGPWTEEEDEVVRDMVMKYGVGKTKWSSIAAELPGRIGKQCRERWFNHLDPDIIKGDWSEADNRILFNLQKKYGNRWCDIAKLIPGRTENAVKNRWNSSSMRKWLKDNNLKPGPCGGGGLEDPVPPMENKYPLGFTMGEMSVTDECDRYGDINTAAAAGMTTATTSQPSLIVRLAKESLSPPLLPTGTCNGISNSNSNTSSSFTSIAAANTHSMVGSGTEQSKLTRYSLPTHSTSNSNHHHHSTTRSTPSENITATATTATSTSTTSSSTSSSSGLPSHLRPPIINTKLKTSYTHLPQDETTLKLIEMLHLLKSTPSPVFSPNRSDLFDDSCVADEESLTESPYSQAESPRHHREDPHRRSTTNSRNSSRSFFPPSEFLSYSDYSVNNNINNSNNNCNSNNIEDVNNNCKMRKLNGDELADIPLTTTTNNDINISTNKTRRYNRVAKGKKKTDVEQPEIQNNNDISSTVKSRNKDASQSNSISNNHPPPPPTSTPCNSQSDLRSNSPSSRALRRVLLGLQIQQQTKTSCGGSNSNSNSNLNPAEEQVPLQMLPYFKFLNETAQRDLMRQLIERFQRTSFTPRNALLGTPRLFGHIGAIGTPRPFETIYPDCFDEVQLLSDTATTANLPFIKSEPTEDSPATATAAGTSEDMHSLSISPTAETTTTTADKNNNSNSSSNNMPSPRYRAANYYTKQISSPTYSNNNNSNIRSSSNNSHLFEDSLTASRAPYSYESESEVSMLSYDDAAIEAAVAVALQVASKSASAEQILMVLAGNDEYLYPDDIPLSSTMTSSSSSHTSPQEESHFSRKSPTATTTTAATSTANLPNLIERDVETVTVNSIISSPLPPPFTSSSCTTTTTLSSSSLLTANNINQLLTDANFPVTTDNSQSLDNNDKIKL